MDAEGLAADFEADLSSFKQVVTEELDFVIIFTLDLIPQASNIRSRSWIWQKKHCAFAQDTGPGVRVFQEGECEEVEVIMAKGGWHTYSRDLLMLVAKDRWSSPLVAPCWRPRNCST